MQTALGLIKGSLRLIGALAEGEEPSPDAAQDALTALRAMIESENNNSLSIYQIQDETFTLAANSTYSTIGSGGDFDTTWPVEVLDSTFTRIENLDYPIAPVNQAQYASIVAKTVTGPFPSYLYYDRAYPLGKIYWWPVPSQVSELHLATLKPLRNFASLTTVVNLPPGYDRFIRYQLAMELAPEYGVEPSPTVVKTAAKARVSLQRINGKNDVMDLPWNLPGSSNPVPWWAIYTGNP